MRPVLADDHVDDEAILSCADVQLASYGHCIINGIEQCDQPRSRRVREGHDATQQISVRVADVDLHGGVTSRRYGWSVERSGTGLRLRLLSIWAP